MVPPWRVANGSAAEEFRSGLKRGEGRIAGEICRRVASQGDVHVAGLRSDGDSDLGCSIADVECRSLVNAWEEPSPEQQHYLGRRVSNRNVDAFAILPVGITPDDGDPVGGVFARKSERSRHERRPNLLEPNQADSGARMVALEFGPQPVRPLPRH